MPAIHRIARKALVPASAFLTCIATVASAVDRIMSDASLHVAGTFESLFAPTPLPAIKLPLGNASTAA
jgi:hypothetical protein